ncbi:MAG: single-stranded-DNA-specific exonuclease RecJ [Ruminococcaceae bacterium]|nr:single-stranded-DNA-specific exonuclease RecJ [Oscillospiraceae bacterium]
MQKKRWKLLSMHSDSERILELSRRYGLPPVVTTILLKRGLASFEDYVFPAIEKLHDPYAMRGMKQAVDRIITALSSGEKITVYGDYDVDGITSTASLVRFLRAHGGDADYYIPDRMEEGYGVNANAIHRIAEAGTSLIITVDCGITAVEETAYAKTLGVDMIITDHHECRDEIPAAVAVLNPKQTHCAYPFKRLAGVGVVFKLLQALTTEMKFHQKELLDSCIDIIALGTVADVMPLMGENRIIVRHGLEQMRYTANRGLRALIKQVGIDPTHITTGTVGFTLAPRINAVGRVGDPRCAVELLLAEDEQTALQYAQLLDDVNRERQTTEQKIYEEALSILAENDSYSQDAVIVLAHPEWHHGIIGIVASRLTEKLNKPTILISLSQGEGKGSGRSIKGFNLFAALAACEEDLTRFGGHELAAGLTVPAQKLENFRRHINEYAAERLSADDFIPELTIDAELPIAYMNLHTVDKLSVMAPYGMGNPAPVFLCRNLKIVALRPMSEGKHLRLALTDGTYQMDAVGFSMGELLHTLSIGDNVDIVFHLDGNVYRGERRAQVLLKDLRLSSQAGGSHG